jgi:rare lipoprotein A
MQKKISLIYFLLTILFAANLRAQSNIPMDTSSQIPALCYREGKASYYANSLHGRRTASGQKYNKNKLTAAHLTLPLGTRVKVTNKKTGKWVIVTINDRGPYSRKYIIDLSYRAAKHLGMTQGKGYAKVVIEEQPKKDQPWPQKHVPEPAGQGLQK